MLSFGCVVSYGGVLVLFFCASTAWLDQQLVISVHSCKQRLQLHGCRPTASTSTCRTAGGWRGTVATTNAIAVPPWQGKARSSLSLSLSSVVQ